MNLNRDLFFEEICLDNNSKENQLLNCLEMFEKKFNIPKALLMLRF